MTDNVRQVAQKQAEEGFELFMRCTKYVCWAIAFSMLALVSCNFGVDGTGSKYNGEQYNPSNINVK